MSITTFESEHVLYGNKVMVFFTAIEALGYGHDKAAGYEAIIAQRFGHFVDATDSLFCSIFPGKNWIPASSYKNYEPSS
jgi:hypothetical protein